MNAVQIREGWVLGVGALFGAAGAVIGLLLLLGVAPDNNLDVGAAVVLLGLARVLP